MSAVTDAKLIIETLIGRSLTGPQLQSIADKVVAADPLRLVAPAPNKPNRFADMNNPTAEEKAQLFLDCTKIMWRQWLSQGGATAARASAQATIDAAAAAAEAELN